eukprot:CAMPEP_0171902354 /NCGR_PEP_ID=MMETSP0993-20121228/1554_1 /TAXON_ID=483369 /ORGANISM="non described non described, Strain CCMP2098" /LENGTH=37 /DNA_ID= /DNA_START= /DNA_END= /DNA_ORIENTATION=
MSGNSALASRTPWGGDADMRDQACSCRPMGHLVAGNL